MSDQRRPRLRAWHSDELAFTDAAEMQKASSASDVLAEKFWAELFGRHPGVQLLTISDMAARWILNHPPEFRLRAENAMIEAIVGLARLDASHGK
jgi:hypothetical protein